VSKTSSVGPSAFQNDLWRQKELAIFVDGFFGYLDNLPEGIGFVNYFIVLSNDDGGGLIVVLAQTGAD
jgi:hypothetical protein